MPKQLSLRSLLVLQASLGALLLSASAAQAAPAFISVTPADGTLSSAATVTLTIEVQAATSLQVDGQAVTTVDPSGTVWTAGPYSLSEGERVLVLIAEDASGVQAQQLHRVVRDSLAPVLSLSQPAAAAIVASSPLTVAGTAVDAHLAAVRVGGQVAALSGASFSHSLVLVEGEQTFTVEASDSLGQSGQQSVTVTLDSQPPTVALLEGAQPLAADALFNRSVVLSFSVTDATATTVEALLDGASFVSGTTVSGAGSHVFSVTATDAAGQPTSVSRSFEIDLTAPTFLSFTPSDGTLLAGSQVTLSGVVEGAAALSVEGQAASLVGQSWTAGALQLIEGEREISIVATDLAGNSASFTLHLERDATAPQLIGLVPSVDSVLATSPVAISGTASDAHLLEVRVGGELASLTGSQFSQPAVALVEGENLLPIVATDQVGHQATAELRLVLDTQAPTLSLLVAGVPLQGGAVFAGPVTPEISASDATEVVTSATLDGATYLPGTVIDGDGLHQLSVSASDAAGHQATVLVSFSLDLAAPVFADLAPVAGSVDSAAQVTLTGRAPGAVSVSVDGQAATLAGDGFSAGPFNLSEGERVFLLAATDSGGNVTQLTHRLTRDSTAPQLTLGQPAAGSLLGSTTVDVSGTASDPRLDQVTVNGVLAEISGGAFLARQVALIEGDNVLTVVAADTVGNEVQTTRSVTVDTTPPTVVITDPASGTITPEAGLTLSGSAADPHLDRVEVAGVGASLVGEQWSLAVDLQEGSNTFTVEAFDPLGHSTSASVTVTRDSSAPEIHIESPAEGLYSPAANLTVSGTVVAEPDLTVTVGGVAATIAGSSWSAAAVPLVEGENRLIARVTDALGNQGTHTRVVWRDNQAPEFLSSIPAAGALELPAGSSFRLRFSEPLAAPSGGAYSLSTLAGQALASSAEIDGDDLVITPQAALPSATELRLVLGAGLVDRAGNALAAAHTLAFTVVDGGSPAAPQLDAYASYLCAPAITLAGSAEPGAWIEVDGGASVGAGQVADDGRFAISVVLLPEGPNHLTVIAVDAAGNPSPATSADIVHDCTAPEVLGASREAAGFRIALSETVDPLTLSGSVRVYDSGVEIAGTVSAAVNAGAGELIWTATAALPSVALLVEVEGALADLAGNPLAFPYRQLFDIALGGSFFSGTAIDDASGRPLGGVRAVVTASDGVALAEPWPEQTSGEDGRLVIALPAGTHDVTFARPGYTPVFRVVTTVDGQGTDVFDPRLTPAAAAVSIDASGGLVEGSSEVGTAPRLTLPLAGLASAAAVRLTAVGGQGLAALLPYGWAPRGAVWVDLSAVNLDSSATLDLPVTSADGTVLEAVTLDLATLQWRSLGVVTVSGGEVTMTVDGEGAWAAVEADSGALAPPPAVAGQMLGSSAAPPSGGVTSASLSFDPEVVLPTQRSWVQVLYGLAAEVPSGVPLTLSIEERLELLDGSVRRISPYSADLVLYRDSLGDPTSRFRLRPSAAARSLPVRLGAEQVSVRSYGDETVRGNVLGPDGGVVSSAEGDQVVLPTGALEEPTAVTLSRRTVADLPLAPPAGGTVDGVLELDLAGRRLLLPAELSWSLTPAPAAGTPGLLLGVVEVEGEPRYRAIAELEATATGWRTQAIDAADLAWPGVLEGGLYVFLRLDAAPRFVRGMVLDPGGAPVVGAVVESTTVPWLQISAAEGGYVLPILLDAATLSARRAVTGNAVAVALPAGVAGERVDLDLPLQIVAPWVEQITPSAGTSGVLLGVNPVVRFSEPVDRASLDGAIELRQGGVAVAVALDHQGALVTLLPQATLVPGSEYEVWVGAAVRDLQGYGLSGSVSVLFSTEVVATPAGVDRGRIFLVEPDAQGLARVEGLAGAAPAGTLVFVENLTSFSTTESVQSAGDGSFLLTIGASLEDQLLLHVLIDGGNEVVILLTPFLGADLRTGLAGTGAGEFTTADGITVRYAAGTFAGPSRVQVTPIAMGTLAAAEDFSELLTFRLEIAGAQPLKPLEVTMAAPAGTAPAGTAAGSLWLLRRQLEIADLPWMVHAELALDGGELSTIHTVGEAQSANSGEVGGTKSGTFDVPAPLRVLSPAEAAARLPRSGFLSALPPADPAALVEVEPPLAGLGAAKATVAPVLADYLVGVSRPGIYQAARAEVELGWIAFPFRGAQDLVVRTAELPEVVLALDAVNRSFLPLGAGALPVELSPTPLNADPAAPGTPGTPGSKAPPAGEPKADSVEIQVLDFAGVELYRVVVDAPTQQVVLLSPSQLPNAGPPMPLGGGPLRFHAFSAAPGTSEIAAGISAELEGNSLTVRGEAGSAGAGVAVRLIDLESSNVLSATASPGGSFSVVASPSQLGDQLVLAISAKLTPGQPLRLDFSEALQEEAPGIRVEHDGMALPITKEPLGSWAQLLIHGGWQAGKTYNLRLDSTMADAAGLPWDTDLTLPFEVAESSAGTSFALDAAHDIARLGSLLFVAAGADGLAVLDASDPRQLKNWLAAETYVDLVAEPGLPVRGVATDSHGRVVAVGGGVARRGVLLILDPQELPQGAATVPAAAILGRTLLTEPQLAGSGAPPLLIGRPLAVEIFNRDESTSWTVGEVVPPGLTLAPPSPPSGTAAVSLTVSGMATAERPVTLRNLTTGERDSARVGSAGGGGAGSFSLSLSVRRGDRLELLRNELSLAYVAGYDAGVVTVDLNAVEAADEEVDDPWDAFDLLRYNTHYFVPTEVLCSTFENDQRFDVIDARVLPAASEGEPWSVLALVENYGLLSLGASVAAPLDKLAYRDALCGEVDGNRKLGGLDVLPGYRFDRNGDGVLDDEEPERDYALLTNTVGGGGLGWLLIVDVTKRDELLLVGRIELPGPATRVTADPVGRRALVSGLGGGVYIVDLDRWPELGGGGGTPQIWSSDRVVERLSFGEDVRAPTLVAPELGLAFAGGVARGVTPISTGLPRLSLVTSGQQGLRRVARLAPFGAPTAPESAEEGAEEIPGVIRVQAQLPGGLADAEGKIRVDLAGIGPAGLPVRGLGEGLMDEPMAELKDDKALVLQRQSDNPLSEGYNVFLSDPVVLLADVRASAHFERSEAEKKVCRRCDLVDEGVYSAADLPPNELHVELLSGHQVRASYSASFATSLSGLYNADLLAGYAVIADSVPWDLSPSPHQEPVLNAATSAMAAPGTLLHSGEMTRQAIDLSLQGRGLDLALVRTYRSQTISNGPLGPGWDHGYRLRLRLLPNGDIDFFDGTGRRETFTLEDDGKLMPPVGRFVQLKKYAEGYTLIGSGYQRWRFDRWGRLVSMIDSVRTSEGTGNEITFHYDSHSRLARIHDDLDRNTFLHYDDEGRLEKIVDFSDRDFLYHYDAQGRLTSFETPDVDLGSGSSQRLSTTYAYHPLGTGLAGQLTQRDDLKSETDAKSQTWLTLRYQDSDGNGRPDALKEQDWGAGTVHLAFDFDGQQTTLTDRRGKVWTYHLNAAGQATSLIDPKSANGSWQYDGEGLLTRATRPLGGATQIEYPADTSGDRRGRGDAQRMVKIADGRGPNGSPSELVTTWEYHSPTHQPSRKTEPGGAVTVWERTDNGLPEQIVRAAGAAEQSITGLSYNARGQLLEATNPNGHVTRHSYFTSGSEEGYLKQTEVDPGGLSLVTIYERNDRGQLEAITDPRGVRHETELNRLDWPLAQVAAASTSGFLAPLGYRTTWRYDANGDITEVASPFGDGSTTTIEVRTFGVLGELLSAEREVAPGGRRIVETSTYDPNLNLLTHIDGAGQRVEREYDDRGQLSLVRRGLGTGALATPIVEHQSYDLDGHLSSQRDGRGMTWEAERDGHGRVLRSRTPLGHYREQSYGAAGDLAATLAFDAGGQLLAESAFTHDLLHRRTETTAWRWTPDPQQPDPARTAEKTHHRWDVASNLLEVEDPLGRLTRTFYDAAERPERVELPEGNVRRTTYDSGGLPITEHADEVDPAGGSHTITYQSTFDALGRRLSRQDGIFANRTLWTVDARGQVTLEVDPTGSFTQRSYDGLNRMTREIRPEGISVDYSWDDASRLSTYTDARGQATRWTYDAVGRRTKVVYPDQQQERWVYDPTGNVTERHDPRGLVVHQSWDDAGRLQSRTVTPPLGGTLEGPGVEAFTFDGLDRLTRAQSGSVVTERVYNSLSHLASETNAGRTTSWQRNALGEPTRTSYPSGRQVERAFDNLGRASTVGEPGAPASIASYGYRGPAIAYKALGNGLLGNISFDGLRRMVDSNFSLAGESATFQESLAWSPRSLKTGQSRGDLGGAGRVFAYDGAKRLIESARVPPALAQRPGNTPPDVALLASLPERTSYQHDNAMNLIRSTTTQRGIEQITDLPPDNRNRPSAVGGVALEWDAAGNMKRKGDMQMYYDFKSRLTRVARAGVEVAKYHYDAFNRRVKVETPTHTEDSVWDGWQSLETYRDGALASRRVYGNGIDEILQQEADLDGDGTVEQTYYPITDSTGNVAMLTGADGKPIERYFYTPFGGRKVLVDSTPPEVEQVRVQDGALWIELSEEVSTEELQASLADGRIQLTQTSDGMPLPLTLDLPVQEGRQARRRLVLTPATPPTDGDSLRLEVAASALSDTFRNLANAGVDLTWTWSAAQEVLQDTAAPRVAEVLLRSRIVEIQFSEEADLAAAASAILLDGQPTSWTLAEDRYTLVASNTLAAGTHTLDIGTDALDLAGSGLAAAFSQALNVPASGDQLAFQAADPRLSSTSAAGNAHGFHGRPVDEETGLLYFRNRYVDPEMGRFVSSDPMGYVDGPSGYQFAGSSPEGFRDPLGLALVFGGDKSLELAVGRLRIRSPQIDATLAKYEGPGEPDLIFQRQGTLAADRDGGKVLQHFKPSFNQSEFLPINFEAMEEETRTWFADHAKAKSASGPRWKGNPTLEIPPIFYNDSTGNGNCDSGRYIDPMSVRLERAYIVVSVKENRAGSVEEAFSLIHELGHADQAANNTWDFLSKTCNDQIYREFSLETESWIGVIPHDERSVEKYADQYRRSVGIELGVVPTDLRSKKAWLKRLKEIGFRR